MDDTLNNNNSGKELSKLINIVKTLRGPNGCKWDKAQTHQSLTPYLLEEAYASDSQILYFPAGLCSRKQKGKIQDLDWKKNFVSKAVKYKRDIIPVHFKGSNSSFFYNLANLRAHSGIKFNIEMIYLPDEMTKQEGKEISLTFGKPVTYQTIIDSGLSMQEWSDKLHKMVHKM